MELKIYFDGLCRVCSAEIDQYRKSQGAERIEFVDITHPQFDAATEGLDPVEVHRSFHVRHADGRIESGVDAFISIWSVLPGWRWLVPIARSKPVKAVLNLGYAAFVKIRPWLPRKSKADCSASPFCQTK
jgi:predicted DCC family thiol-disulfide oxidoreductase YuxK